MKKRVAASLNRRDFLSTAVSGVGCAGLLGLGGFKPASTVSESIGETREDHTIIRRDLGKTGIRIPVVNMGVMNTLDTALMQRSYEKGVRHFDTAAWYIRGRNEEMLGKAIRELGVRDQVIIGTKIYIPHNQRDMSPADVKAAYLKIADESLKRLQMEYVDILYSHNVGNLEWLNNPGILEALHMLKQQGKARHIGFTTHENMAVCINDAVRSGLYEVILTAFNYAMAGDEVLLTALQKASLHGIGLIAMKTQCSQYWYREHVPEDSLGFYKGDILHTAVLKWVLRHRFISAAVPGYTTFQQLEEDFSVAYDLEYTPEEKKFLEDRNVTLAMKKYCRQCRQCVDTCPHDVDVPTLMRTHLYAACYSNFYQARDALAEIPAGKGLDACSQCRECTASCAGLVDIQRRLDELKALFC